VDIRGGVRLIMDQMDGIWMAVCTAKESLLMMLSKTSTALGTALKTLIAQFIMRLRVVIQWSIDHLHVLKLTLLALLIRCGLTIVSLVHTAIGSLHRITVRQLQRLAMKQASLERTFAQKDLTGQ